MSAASGRVFALILAGGSGTRFWPVSRHALPKQLLDLFGTGKSMLAQTAERLAGLTTAENMIVLTNCDQEAAVRAELPGVPRENIIAEPEKRDTGPAIALGIAEVARRDPSAVMVIVPADQKVGDAEAFRTVMTAGAKTADRSDAVVTVGISPTWPCRSYGYIERGERLPESEWPAPGMPVHRVRRFREKPDPETAQAFLDAGNFSWNAGIFIWSVRAALRELGEHCPELAAFAGAVRDASDPASIIRERFGTLPKVSIDYALMERASQVLNIEATFDWDDVGGWLSVGKYLPCDENGIAANCPVTAADSGTSIVFSQTGTRVALLGVEGLVVVQTPDAILIADRRKADDIKKLVDALPPELQ